MQLSERLKKIASMVTEGNRLADVGTDHGYVPIYLYEGGKIPGAIAMDINKGPLERADLHIGESGLRGKIETRLSDGLEALNVGEADTILIAGMGGPLMLKILCAYPQVTASAKELVLQPQSEIGQVRAWLGENEYEIAEEHIVFEEGKYYPMFRAVKNPDAKKLTTLECSFGRLDVLEEKDVLKAFVLKELSGKQAILKTLADNTTEKARDREKEIREMIGQLGEVLRVL